MFEVIIQAVAGRRVVARETLKPFRKDVLAKLHATDVSRRKKLLEKQKEGRKKLKGLHPLSLMSFLRRRFLGESTARPSREFTPEKGEEVRLVSVAKLKKLTSKKSKRRNGLVFGLGGLFGLIVAAFFANQQDVINLEGLLDMNLDSLFDVIPAGIIKDAKDITVWNPSALKF
ncbi:MAG: hypothetical protein Q9187_009455 [Circinaria calcarea]